MDLYSLTDEPKLSATNLGLALASMLPFCYQPITIIVTNIC